MSRCDNDTTSQPSQNFLGGGGGCKLMLGSVCRCSRSHTTRSVNATLECVWPDCVVLACAVTANPLCVRACPAFATNRPSNQLCVTHLFTASFSKSAQHKQARDAATSHSPCPPSTPPPPSPPTQLPTCIATASNTIKQAGTTLLLYNCGEPMAAAAAARDPPTPHHP